MNWRSVDDPPQETGFVWLRMVIAYDQTEFSHPGYWNGTEFVECVPFGLKPILFEYLTGWMPMEMPEL